VSIREIRVKKLRAFALNFPLCEDAFPIRSKGAWWKIGLRPGAKQLITFFRILPAGRGAPAGR
jgi:hypothetical protein